MYVEVILKCVYQRRNVCECWMDMAWLIVLNGRIAWFLWNYAEDNQPIKWDLGKHAWGSRYASITFDKITKYYSSKRLYSYKVVGGNSKFPCSSNLVEFN